MAREKAEAARTYSAYRVVEGGEEHYFRMTPGEELLDAARTLRKYLKDTGHSTGKFISLYLQAQPITPEEYQNLMRLRMENTGKVTGVFDLDFDKREFSADGSHWRRQPFEHDTKVQRNTGVERNYSFPKPIF